MGFRKSSGIGSHHRRRDNDNRIINTRRFGNIEQTTALIGSIKARTRQGCITGPIDGDEATITTTVSTTTSGRCATCSRSLKF